MDKKVKDLHEKIADAYNTMWAAYKKYLDDGHVRHINDAASDSEMKYQDDKTVLQFIWYQKASWSGIVEQVKEWSR
jgi:hypothetical protein